MSSKNSVILILWTCATLEEARRICRELVEKKMIACANIVPHVESIYFWQDKVETGSESKVFLKTLESHFEAVKDHIKAQCSYQVPEISQIRIEDCNADYFSWVESSVSKSIDA